MKRGGSWCDGRISKAVTEQLDVLSTRAGDGSTTSRTRDAATALRDLLDRREGAYETAARPVVAKNAELSSRLA